MKSLSRVNAIFLFALAATFTAAAVGLVLISSYRRVVGGKPVGVVSQKSNTAEQRFVGDPIWAPVFSNGEVYDRDTVRTGPSSSMTINLGDGVEIVLGEQSMVYIDVSADKTRLRVSGGAVAVSNARKSFPVRLETRVGAVEVKKGNVQLRQSVEGMNVELRDGEAFVVADGESVTLNEPSILDTATRQVRVTSAELKEPSQGEIVHLASPADRISVVWECDRNDGARLMIARDADFDRPEIDVTLSGNRYEAKLSEGLHYWKIYDRSPVQWFTVTIARPPRLITPVDAAFTYLDALPVIPFIWSDPAGVGEYRLEIISAQGGDNPVLVESVRGNRISIDTLGAGSYSWRVVAIEGPADRETPSAYAPFSVSTAPLKKPILRPNVESPSRFALMRGAPAISWNRVEAALSYEVIVSRDVDGMAIERRVVTNDTFLRMTDAPPVGEYHVRVRAHAGKASSEPSDSARISVAEAHPLVAVSPIRSVSPSPKDGSINFSWADPNGGVRYQFKISARETFDDNLALDNVDKRSYSFVVEESTPRMLYWAASLIGPDGQAIATTGTQSVRVIRRLGVVVPIEPVNGERLDINGTNRIRFSWKPVNNASAYEIHLFRVSAGLSAKVRSWRTDANEIILDDFAGLAIADYSWTATAVGGTEDDFAPSIPSVSYFRLTQSSTLPAPRINLMSPAGGTAP